MALSERESKVVGALERLGQSHVRGWLESLQGRSRARLLEELARVDLGRLAEFRRLLETPPTELSFEGVVPAPVERMPLEGNHGPAEREAVRLGVEALRAGRVAALTVAGGQGTRLGYPHPKGMYPISPIRRASLFRLFAEQVLAARRRYGCHMPWLIMTSPTNDAETREFFAENEFFGLDAGTVHFFVQGVNPILDAEGRLLRAEKDRLLVGPDGHGGAFAALAASGLLERLRGEGHDLISYFQVDNPLVKVADPRFIGHHLRKRADFSCKVVAKREPQEGLGIAVLRGDRPAIIEYVHVPEQVASLRAPSGKLLFNYGSIAIHIIRTGFAESVNAEGGLPWNVAAKRYTIVDDRGRKARSAPGACRKFERFIFDALALVDAWVFVETRRSEEFAPVKNAEGEDSPRSARRLMQRRWLNWLRRAGASFDEPDDLSVPVIEISPLFAADEETLRERIERGWTPSFPLLLEG